MPTILITTDPAHTTAFFAPTSFLGSDLFSAFRTALTTGGARAVKVRGAWTNQAPIAAAPKVVAALQTAGFATDMSEDVRKVLTRGAQAMVSDLHGADQILAQIKADLARRGQALRQYQIEGVRARARPAFATDGVARVHGAGEADGVRLRHANTSAMRATNTSSSSGARRMGLTW